MTVRTVAEAAAELKRARVVPRGVGRAAAFRPPLGCGIASALVAGVLLWPLLGLALAAVAGWIAGALG